MILPYVYKLTHKETGQFYIGSRTCKNLKLPSYEDIIKYKSSSIKVKELGFENFNVEIIAEFFDRIHAYEFEQLLIYENFKDPLNINGCCHVAGKRRFSNLGVEFTEDHKNKISESHKGKSFSDQSRKKMSLAKSGNNHPNFGKPRTQITKEKLSQKNTGENHPNFGCKGCDNPRYGMKHSEESKKKMSESRSGEKNHKAKNVLVNGKKYSTITAAARDIGIKHSYLSIVLNGKYKLNDKIWQAEYLND